MTGSFISNVLAEGVWSEKTPPHSIFGGVIHCG
jgi:hypothetical protein